MHHLALVLGHTSTSIKFWWQDTEEEVYFLSFWISFFLLFIECHIGLGQIHSNFVSLTMNLHQATLKKIFGMLQADSTKICEIVQEYKNFTVENPL